MYAFKTFYRTETTVYEFTVPTNIASCLLQRIVQLYLGITTPDGGVGYRIIRRGTSEELRSLGKTGNWDHVLLGIRSAAEQGRCEGLEILNVSDTPH